MKCAVWMVTLVEDLYFNLLGKMTSCRKLSVRSPLRYKWRISLNFISGFLTLRSYKFGLEVHLRFPYFKKLHVWSWKNVERRRSSVFKESSFPCVWLFRDSFQFSHACLMMIVFPFLGRDSERRNFIFFHWCPLLKKCQFFFLVLKKIPR